MYGRLTIREICVKVSEGDDHFVDIFKQIKVVDLGYCLIGKGNEVRKKSEDKNNDSTAHYDFYSSISRGTG
jgi:hypothetical protein